MTWPTPQEYNEALQNPALSLSDATLQKGMMALNPLGLPRAITGAFASVYRIDGGGESWAVRCFLSDRPEQKERYSRISDFFSKSEYDFVVPFSYLDEGVRVKGSWYPIVKMEWIEGEPLDLYLRKHYKNSGRMAGLAESFKKLARDLEKAGIAHGDLQHGNILVSREKLYLVDYDAFFVPSLSGMSSLELGHRNYQHPRRTGSQYDTTVDNFTCWLIHSALRALAIDHKLYDQFGQGDECILFKELDLRSPLQSSLFERLLAHESNEIRNSANLLLRMLWSEPDKIPELSANEQELSSLVLIDIEMEREIARATAEESGTEEEFEPVKSVNDRIDVRIDTPARVREDARKKTNWRKFATASSVFWRTIDFPQWLKYKMSKAESLYEKGNYRESLSHYGDIYKRVQALELDDSEYVHRFRRITYQCAILHWRLGSNKLAHNYFLACYKSKYKLDEKEKVRTSIALAISHYLNGEKEASLKLFTEYEESFTKNWDSLLKNEYLNQPTLFYLICDALETKSDAKEFQMYKQVQNTKMIMTVAQNVYEKMAKNQPECFDIRALEILLQSIELRRNQSEIKDLNKRIEDIGIAILHKRAHGKTDSEEVTISRIFEVAGVSHQRLKAYKATIEWLEFEQLVNDKKLYGYFLLDRLEKLSRQAMAKFIFRSLPKHPTIDSKLLLEDASIERYPNSYKMLLTSVIREMSDREYSKYVSHLINKEK